MSMKYLVQYFINLRLQKHILYIKIVCLVSCPMMSIIHEAITVSSSQQTQIKINNIKKPDLNCQTKYVTMWDKIVLKIYNSQYHNQIIIAINEHITLNSCSNYNY